MNARNYTASIRCLNTLMDNYGKSLFLIPSVDQIYINYFYLDSINNFQNTYHLFTTLRDYIEAKIQQYSTNTAFVMKAYDSYLMCLTKIHNFQEAITGYENIMNNSQDKLRRLFASWDRAAVILMMNGDNSLIKGNQKSNKRSNGSQKSMKQGNGGGYKNIYTENVLNKYIEELSIKPVHQIAKEVFSYQKINIQSKSNNKIVSLLNNLNIDNSKIEQRITKFSPKNSNELQKKIADDLKILTGQKGKTKIIPAVNLLPKKFKLYQNYPNPFNPSTKIKFDLPMKGYITLKIYDILGREIETLVNNELKQAGTYEMDWNGSRFASGVYFYKLKAGQYTEVKKMVLIK